MYLISEGTAEDKERERSVGHVNLREREVEEGVITD